MNDEEQAVAQLPTLVPDGGVIGTIVKAELDTSIATARANPRSIHNASNAITSLATLDEKTCEENIYAMPRAGKPIRGPSIRFAEIVAQNWGNCRVDAAVVNIDRVNKVVSAQAIFHDLESNVATRQTVNRRISDKRGRLFSDDMIVTTGNAACSIARRNAILSGVPKAIWRKAYEASEKVVAGDVKTLATRREAAVKAFAAFGVKPEQIFAVLECNSIEDVTLDDLLTLQSMYAQIKNGEGTVEEMFDPRRAAIAHEVVQNPLKDEEIVAEPPPVSVANGDAGAASTAAPQAAPDLLVELNAAHQRGIEARKAGQKRNQIPNEFKDAAHSRHAEMWMDGFDGKPFTNPQLL